MFEDLSKIDWKPFWRDSWKLELPTIFEELVSPTIDSERAAYLAEFLGSVFCHQGTIDKATYLILPFLFELVLYVPDERRSRIIEIIYAIALSASIANDKISAKVYKHLCQRKDFFEKLLSNNNSDTRKVAALTFCLVEQDIEHRIKVIGDRIRVEIDPNVQMNLVQLLGYMIHPEGSDFDNNSQVKLADESIYFSQLETLSKTSQYKIVRLTAAVAILHIKRDETTDEYIEIVLNILPTLKQTEVSHKNLYRLFDSFTYLGEARGVEKLVLAIEAANDSQVALSLSHDLLRHLFEYKDYQYVSFEMLSQIQRKAVQAIVNNDKLWKEETIPIPRYRGLSDQRHVLLSLLNMSNSID